MTQEYFVVINDDTDNLVVNQIFTKREKAEAALERHALKQARDYLVRMGHSRESINYSECLAKNEALLKELRDILVNNPPQDVNELQEMKDEIAMLERDNSLCHRHLAAAQLGANELNQHVEVWYNLLRVKKATINVDHQS